MHKFKLMLFAFSILAAQELFAKAGWINLFNGKDLSGWTQKTGNARFFVDDGCIVGEAVSESDTNSVLCTEKDYDNFILELDFKVDHQLFSGVHIRSEYAAKNTRWDWDGRPLTIPEGHVYGYLVLIDPSPNHRWWTATLYDQRWWTAGIYDEMRRLWLYPGSLGGDPDEFSRKGREIFNTNGWNHLRIEAVGDSIKTYLNGVLCAHINDSLTAKGFIGLQVRAWISDDDHETLAGAKVRFKNIRLKPVSPKPPKAGPSPNTHTEKKETRLTLALGRQKPPMTGTSATAEDYSGMAMAEAHGKYCGNFPRVEEIIHRIETNTAFRNHLTNTTQVCESFICAKKLRMI